MDTRAELVFPSSAEGDRSRTVRRVIKWVKQAWAGRGGHTATIRVADVRPDPFVRNLADDVIETMATGIRNKELDPDLWVAGLPDGTYVDVATPHLCEAVRRAGLKLVKAHVVGTFSEIDRRSIGLSRRAPTQARDPARQR